MKLFIIRHADPDYANHTITAQGHLEAQALAQRMEQLRPDHLYCSPVQRAIDTARYTAERLQQPVTTEEWTAELSDCRINLDPWGELCVWDTPGELIRARHPMPTSEDWHERDLFDRPLYRKTYERLQACSDEFIARHGYRRDGGRYRIQKPNRDKVAVFCHGGFGLWWLAHLLEIPLPLVWAGFWLPPSSVTTILFDERSERWATPRCIGSGDVSHLYAAGLAVQPSGIKANAE